MEPTPSHPGTLTDDRVVGSAGLVVTSIVSLQSGAVLAVVAFREFAPETVASLRMLLAAGLLLVFARPREIRARARSRTSLRLALALGVCLAAMHICIYEALERVPIGLATTLEAAGPLALAALVSRRRSQLVWIGFAAAGVVLAAQPSHGAAALAGIVFGILAGLCWAGYVALNKRCAVHFQDTLGLLLAFAFGGALLLPWACLGLGRHSVAPWAVVLLPSIAILSSAVPFSLETRALRTLSEYMFSILTSLYPAVGGVLGYMLLGQHLAFLQVLGIGCVIAASVGAISAGRARTRRALRRPRDDGCDVAARRPATRRVLRRRSAA